MGGHLLIMFIHRLGVGPPTPDHFSASVLKLHTVNPLIQARTFICFNCVGPRAFIGRGVLLEERLISQFFKLIRMNKSTFCVIFNQINLICANYNRKGGREGEVLEERMGQKCTITKSSGLWLHIVYAWRAALYLPALTTCDAYVFDRLSLTLLVVGVNSAWRGADLREYRIYANRR